MKIAFLNIYNGWVHRGAETFVKELASCLSQTHEVTVFQGGKKETEKYHVEEIKLEIDWSHKDTTSSLSRPVYLDFWSRAVFLFTIKCLPKIWREKPYIVVPVNGGWQVAILRVVTWLYGGKLVVSGQSGKGWVDANNLWSFPDAFIALSEEAYDWAKKRNPFVTIKNIPNGVDTKKFTPYGPGVKTRLKEPIVLYVGALEEGKRPQSVIRAVACLEKVNLLLVGDGDMRDSIVKLGKKMLGERFEWKKFTHDKMPSVYRVANVFTIPSRSHYSFEIVLTEAMATNIPVVANDDTIRRGIVGNAGVFTNPENTHEYADALEKVLKTKWGNKPREQAERFSWDKIAEQYNRLFRSLVT